MIRFLFLLLFPFSVHAIDLSIPDDLKKQREFQGVCNDPACHYKTPRINFRNAPFLIGQKYGFEYAVLAAISIGIGDQLIKGRFDIGDAAYVAASKFLYYRYEF